MMGTDATLKATSGHEPAAPDAKHSMEGLVQRVIKEVQEGVRHGHFDLSISGAHARGGCIEVIVKAGKNYRFLIPGNSGQP